MKKAALLFLILMIISCSQGDDFLLKEYQKSFSEILGLKVDLEEYSISGNSDYKVLILLNTKCASCVLTVKRWSQFMDSSILKNKSIVFLSYGPEDEYFSNNFQEALGTKKNLNHIYDPTGNFIYENDLELFSLDVFLLDKSNKVLLIGDPTKDELVKSFYKNF